MQIKIGDLVYVKQHSYANWRHNNEIWIATDICSCDGKVRIMNIHNQNVVTYNPRMLMKVDTDKN